MKSIAVFNSKGGAGKTSLTYHLAWMYAKLDYNVLVADLDPQANLTSMFLGDDELEALWDASDTTIHACMQPLLAGTGDVTMPKLLEPTPSLSLVAGDMRLANAEDELASQWLDCLDGKERAFRVLSAIWRGLRLTARHVRADLALLDVGSNLGALNRAALLAADHVVVPVAPDLRAVQACGTWGQRCASGAANGPNGATATRLKAWPFLRGKSSRSAMWCCSSPCGWIGPARFMAGASRGFPTPTAATCWTRTLPRQRARQRTTGTALPPSGPLGI